MQLTKQQSSRGFLDKFRQLEHKHYLLLRRQIESNKRELLPKLKLLDLKLKDSLLKNKLDSKQRQQLKLKDKDLNHFHRFSVISLAQQSHRLIVLLRQLKTHKEQQI